MALCPVCKTPGAYVGFSSVECRNPRCAHFVIEEEKICPCCGIRGHNQEYEMMGMDLSFKKDVGATTVNPATPQPSPIWHGD